MNQQQPPILLRLPGVVRATGLGARPVYKLIATGQFPAPLRLTSRSVAWRFAEIEAWVASRQRTY